MVCGLSIRVTRRGRKVAGDLKTKGSRSKQQIGWEYTAEARGRPSGTSGSSEPGDSDEVAPWVVAAVVADAVEASRLKGTSPGMRAGVVRRGAQLTSDAEAVGGSCRKVGHA
jgi:hypothetical protein